MSEYGCIPPYVNEVDEEQQKQQKKQDPDSCKINEMSPDEQRRLRDFYHGLNITFLNFKYL